MVDKKDLCKQCHQFPKEPGFERCMLCLKQLDSPVKEYRGIISGRIEKWRDQKKAKNNLSPATKEEIEQLKLERERALLNRDISEAQEQTKTQGRNYWNIFRNVVGSDNSTTQQTRSKRRKERDPYDKASSILDKSTGKNQKRDYSDLTG